MKNLKHLFFLNLIFASIVLPQALATNEKTFELLKMDYWGSGWAPKRLLDPAEISNTLFPGYFLGSPVGKMVNSNKNPELRINEKLNFYESQSKHCSAQLNNNDSAKHCYTVPTNLENIINHGQDAPIKMIQKLHEQSYSFWSNFEVPKTPSQVQAYGTTNYQTVTIHIEPIKQLNIRAAQIWNKLVACNNNDPEQARIAFFYSNQTKICASGSSNNAEVFQLIQTLAFNFQEYMISTLPIAVLNSYTESDSTLSIFRNPHPLLTEFAILNWSAFYNHAGEDKFSTSPIVTGSMFQFDDFKQDLRMNLNFGDSFKRPVRTMQVGAEILFKNIVNNLIFISMIQYDDLEYSCGQYGLWPALNRSILYNTNLLNFHSNPIYRELSYLDEIVTRNCGPKVDFLNSPEMSGVYGLYFQSNLINMRLRYIDYLGNQHLPKDED
jgi:hypothetical protein